MQAARTLTLRAVALSGVRTYATTGGAAKKKAVAKPIARKGTIPASVKEARRVAVSRLSEPQVDYQKKALELASIGKFQESLQAFQLALKETPNDPAIHGNMGAVALDAGLPELAEKSLTKAFNANPDDLIIRFHLSRSLQMLGADLVPEERDPYFDRAEKLLKDGLVQEELWVEAYSDLGNICAARGKIKKALSYYEQALTIAAALEDVAKKRAKRNATKSSKFKPQIPAALAHRLMIARKAAFLGVTEVYINHEGDAIRGLQSLKAAAALDRKDTTVLSRIGDVYVGLLGKPKRGLLYYKECLRLEPENAAVHKQIGMLVADPDYSGHDLEKAKRCFETALRFKATPEILFHLGWVNIQLGDVSRGRECLDKVIKLDKDPDRVVKALCLLGDVEMVQETPAHAKQALTFFEQAAKIADKYKSEAPSLRTSMAKCHVLLDETRRALEILQPVVEKSPKNVDALALLAEILFIEGRPNDAIGVVERGLKIDKRNPQLNFWYGRFLFRSGEADPSASMKFLSKAIVDLPEPISPEVLQKAQEGKLEGTENLLMPPPFAGEAHLMLGLLFEGNEQHAEALDHYRIASEYDPDSPVVHIRVGAMLEATDKSSEAQEAFRRASVLDPDSVEANFLLGNSFAEKQLYEQAILYYNKAAGNTAKRPQEATTDILFRLYNNLSMAHKELLKLTKLPVHDQQAREYLKLANQYGIAKDE